MARMNTGYLGNRSSQSDQQIGDVTLSYNKTTAAGNALLATNGAMLDAKKYPLLAAKLGTKLEPAPLRLVHSFGKSYSLGQSDDGEYCFYTSTSDANVYRYKKNDSSASAVLDIDGVGHSPVACSASGQYVLALLYHNSSRKTDIYYSNNYGDSFSVAKSFPATSETTLLHEFVSRDGRHLLAIRCLGATSSFAISHDFGASWSQHTANHAAKFECCTQDLSKMYFIKSGAVFVSSDYGKTLTPSTMDLPANMSRLRVDPLNNDVMAAAFAHISELRFSTDGGSSWRRLIDPRLLRVWHLRLFSGVITVIFYDDNNAHHLMVSHDHGATWHQSKILGTNPSYNDARMTKGSTNYFAQQDGLYYSKIEEITRLPLGNLNSERIIADKVV